jgi:hypothetical protein
LTVTSRSDIAGENGRPAPVRGGIVVTLCVALLAMAAPGTAWSKAHSFHATKVQRGVATFKLRRLAPSRIRSAHLSGPRTRKLSLRQIRAAARRGVLHIRVAKRGTSAWSRPRAKRLKLVVVTGRRSPRTGAKSLCLSSSGFGVGNWPAGCWRPYSSSSPFNRVLAANPRLDPDSHAIVSRLVRDYGGRGPQDVDVGSDYDDWKAPVYYASSSDPLFTVDCTESWGTCEPERRRIRIPEAARAAQGGDGHMAVVQPNGDEYDFWQVVRKGGGRLQASWGGVTSIFGSGLGSDATAAHFGLLAGLIRGPELEAGEIRHALVMAVQCVDGSAVYPSVLHADFHSCSEEGRSNANAPAMGMRFQLDYSDGEISSLRVPAWKKTILTAMAHYGVYVEDTGTGSWGIAAESGSSYTSFGHQDPLAAFARKHGVPGHNGTYSFDIRDGVDWSRLRVVDPCVSRGAC